MDIFINGTVSDLFFLLQKRECEFEQSVFSQR